MMIKINNLFILFFIIILNTVCWHNTLLAQDISTENSKATSISSKKHTIKTENDNLTIEAKVSLVQDNEILQNIEKNKNGNILNGYLIALAVLGFFSMYNAFEIYKTKGQFDKDTIEIISNLQNKYIEQERRQLDLEISRHDSYKELNENINKIKNDMIEFNELINSSISNYQVHFDEFSNSIQKQYHEIESYINKFIDTYDGSMYLYQLYSLIPNYIMDKSNRDKVFSAVTWISQNGTEDDVEVLKERKEKISIEDTEMHKLFESRINELKFILNQHKSKVG